MGVSDTPKIRAAHEKLGVREKRCVHSPGVEAGQPEGSPVFPVRDKLNC